jgi:hypothetical protein
MEGAFDDDRKNGGKDGYPAGNDDPWNECGLYYFG